MALSRALIAAEQEMLVMEEKKSRLNLFSNNEANGAYKKQDVQLCRICFTTDRNLCSMKMDNTLDRAYETLTGLSIENEDNMPPYLCSDCSHQLMHCIHFRNKTLRAHLLLLEILRTHDCITLETIKNINEDQDMIKSNLNVPHNSINEYEFETLHIKKENENSDTQISLKNDPSSRDHIVRNGIKKEDDFFSQDSSIDVDNTVYSADLREGILPSYIKVEENDVYTENQINDEVSVDMMYNADAFEGGSDYNVPVEDQRTDDDKVRSTTNVNGLMHTKSPGDLKQKSNNDLLLFDNLCCDMCPYKTISDIKFLSHLKTHTSKSYKCKFTTKIRQKVYSSEKRFSCHVCKKTFSRKWGLQKHMKTHSGNKQYMCGTCDKGFNENRDLQNHLRTHSGEKPYGCDLCKKSFSERGNLLRHIRIHAGERPYSCKVCKISFNQKHHLKRHLTKHYD